MIRSAGLLPILLLAGSLGAAERWRIQFPPDRKHFNLTINDLKFPSPARGVAVGRLGEGRKSRPVVLETSDGGNSWSFRDTPVMGLSLFFLDEQRGWMVTAEGVWKTVESGRSWTRLPASPAIEGALRVHFLDENRGWVVGRRKSVYTTSDGGKNWSRVGEAEAVDCNPDYTSYNWITFVNRRVGMITGASLPPQPSVESQRRELPHLTIFLDTRDGGETWKPSTASMFGRVTKVLFSADGQGLGLVEFQNDFEFPSEVFRIDGRTGKSWRVFRRADRAVTDLAFDAVGAAYLAAIEPRGRKRPPAAPGKLRLLKSRDLSEWTEVELDDCPPARRAILAVVDEGHAWLATDTGVILRLNSK